MENYYFSYICIIFINNQLIFFVHDNIHHQVSKSFDSFFHFILSFFFFIFLNYIVTNFKKLIANDNKSIGKTSI